MIQNLSECCDSKGVDYKIVRFFNSWRIIGFKIEGQKLDYMDYHVYLEGKCFWLTVCEEGHSSVVCLDVGSKEFQVVHLPVEAFDMDRYLRRYNDKSCATENHNDSFDIDVWVQSSTDYGGHSYSWTYFLKIEQVPALYAHMGFWKTSVVLVDYDRIDITIYNPLTGKFKPLGDVRLF